MTNYKDDPDLNVFPNLKYVASELWQVKSGTLFDNILICDDPEYAKKFAEETWGKQKDADKAAFDEVGKKKEAEVRRVQTYVEALDLLKIRNAMPNKAQQQQKDSVVVTTKWETFDPTPATSSSYSHSKLDWEFFE
ncbi:putative calreticulin 1b [Cinnamomum micranthum f. kanehirae]|uniref:Putative calreticulin 1b n=1 Tax=Cinnamomum micranthum f. kanehirae TaxID=337451 RepID=A0A3S3PDF9_9MAGN|nr:putative calreticulin 1b [Cinnamomum micranthum f. kanehirae]